MWEQNLHHETFFKDVQKVPRKEAFQTGKEEHPKDASSSSSKRDSRSVRKGVLRKKRISWNPEKSMNLVKPIQWDPIPKFILKVTSKSFHGLDQVSDFSNPVGSTNHAFTYLEGTTSSLTVDLIVCWGWMDVKRLAGRF